MYLVPGTWYSYRIECKKESEITRKINKKQMLCAFGRGNVRKPHKQPLYMMM